MRRFEEFTYAESCFAQISDILLDNTSPHRVYGNAFMSRIPAFVDAGVEKMKPLWRELDVVLVTDAMSAFSIDPRLFDNWRSINRVFGLSAHAYSGYEALPSHCLRIDRRKLFLISLGPTATVLAYDLSAAGYQALDIGHLLNCFHEFLGEAGTPERERKTKR